MNQLLVERVQEPGVLEPDEWRLLSNSVNAYIISESVYAACELDIFSKIASLDVPNLANIASVSGLSEYACSVLLMCLCCSGLISKTKNTDLYSIHSAARKALCAGTMNSFIPFVRYNHQIQQKGMTFFLEALQVEKNVGVNYFPGSASNIYDRLAESPDLSEVFHQGMAAYTHFGPKIVAFKEMKFCTLLLDVGGGNGSVSRKILAEHDTMRAVVIDIPSVCALGKTLNQEFEGRLDFVAMDLLVDDWSFKHDGLLFSHILEIFSLEKISFLYKKAYASLPKGGRLFLWTIVSDDAETGSLQAAKSSAYFLTLAIGEGKAYSAKCHIEQCEAAGFQIEATYDRTEYDHFGLVAIKQ